MILLYELIAETRSAYVLLRMFPGVLILARLSASSSSETIKRFAAGYASSGTLKYSSTAARDPLTIVFSIIGVRGIVGPMYTHDAAAAFGRLAVAELVGFVIRAKAGTSFLRAGCSTR
jgi:hypothetical protein